MKATKLRRYNARNGRMYICHLLGWGDMRPAVAWQLRPLARKPAQDAERSAKAMGEGQLNRISEKLVASLKRTTPASALRHGVRIATIIAKASFWAVCYHYFGTKALLYVAASWMFMLGVKDLTFARVRLSSLQNPEKRTEAFRKSVSAELVLIAIRLGAIFALSWFILPFNRNVAEVLPILAVCAGLWARETFIATSMAYGTGSLRVYVAFIAAASSIGSVITFAENNLDAIHSAIWALLIREAVMFTGYAAVALIGAFGIRLQTVDDLDEDEGGDAMPILAPDGREVRSAWKILIADNVVYSRWRLMHFATRFVAHGILGPFGGVATRIAFTYRKPRPYAHHSNRISVGKIVLFVVAAGVIVSAIGFFAQRAGLLQALGIVVAAFVFRLAALGMNLLIWRQLSPIVGRNKARTGPAEDEADR
jgi:hypothetical protein